MKSFAQPLLAASMLAGAVLAAPTDNQNNKPMIVHPIPADQINASNLQITALNTYNTTAPPTDRPATPNAVPSVPLQFVNNLDSNNLKFYITATDPTTNAAVFVKPDGSLYVLQPASGDQPQQIDTSQVEHSISGKGSTTDFSFAAPLVSARIYISDGSLTFFTSPSATLVAPSVDNPSDTNAKVNFGYAEFTYTESGEMFGNLSYIDFVGLIIGAIFKTSSATTEVKGLPSDGVSQLCSKLQQQGSSDGQPWGNLCMSDDSGNLIRVINPEHLPGKWEAYWSDYIDQVWSKYASEDLTINTQNAQVGDITGRVGSDGNLLFSAYPSFSFPKPTADDVWGCASGPFSNPDCNDSDPSCVAQKAIVARLCAAFDRTTLLIDGGNTQPNGPSTDTYYQNTPTNQFSKFVHQLELDGKGYAFAYDDVHPDSSADLAGTWHSAPGETINAMTLVLGGPSS